MQTAQFNSARPILERVSGETGVTVDEIASELRTSRICFARYMAAFLIRKMFPEWALHDVAVAVGRTDHTTALFAINSAKDLIETNPRFARSVRIITASISEQ